MEGRGQAEQAGRGDAVGELVELGPGIACGAPHVLSPVLLQHAESHSRFKIHQQ